MTYVNAPIPDLLIRIKNAYMARKNKVEGTQHSNFKIQVLKLLKSYKFIKDFETVEDGKKKFITIYLNPIESDVNDIPNIKFYSTPSRPWYVGYKDLKQVAGGKGVGILSTSQGLMPTHVAKKKKLGGKLIAEIF